MKKIFLILALILGLTFTAFAEDQKATQTDGLKIKPKFYWSTVSPFIIHKFYRLGFTVIGFDGSLFQYKNFCFLSVGAGLQTYQKKVIGWHVYYDYWGFPQSYYGEGYKFKFEFYLKFIPVKWRWNWASEVLEMDTYLELGITHKKDIVFGLTFSGNPFKKKKGLDREPALR